MHDKHDAMGKCYRIACPEGSRLVCRSEVPAPGGSLHADVLVVPFEGQDIPIPADPPGLLPLLAEAGRCGLALVGEPEPDVRLAGVACPECGERDVNWLNVEDDGAKAHCDRCGADFEPCREAIVLITPRQ